MNARGAIEARGNVYHVEAHALFHVNLTVLRSTAFSHDTSPGRMMRKLECGDEYKRFIDGVSFDGAAVCRAAENHGRLMHCSCGV